MSGTRKPVVIELGQEAATAIPADAPAVPDELTAPPSGRAMQAAIGAGAARGSALRRWFLRFLGAAVLFFGSIWAWDAISNLFLRSPQLGWIGSVLLGGFLLLGLGLVIKELAAIARIRRLDRLQTAARNARDGDLAGALAFSDRLAGFYAARDDTAWGRGRLKELAADAVDADALLDHCEREILGPLDTAAIAEIEASSRRVAAATALVPLALADVAVALWANVSMIRRIAEIYGGRSGTFGSWRLARSVMTHLVATGAVAVGDDVIGSVAGGGLVSKLSRRFGEGVINGALTARVGIAAIEVCRPMPFAALSRPRVTTLVSRALAGLFSRASGKA